MKGPGFYFRWQSERYVCLLALVLLISYAFSSYLPAPARDSEIGSVPKRPEARVKPVEKIDSKTVGKSAKARASTVGTATGWVLKVSNDKLGLSKYSFTRTQFKAETPMLLVVADAKTNIVTIGTWETKKSFTFPVNKSKYYADLMGVSAGGQGGSDFRREYQQSPWVKTRTLMVGEMPASEYVRHVTNPPRGRSRTQFQIVSEGNVIAPSLLTIYYRLVESTPAADLGLVLGDRVEITNPKQGWIDLETKSARTATLTREDMRFPAGFKKVESVSELFLSENSPFESEAGKSSMVSPLGKIKRTIHQ